MAGRILQIAQAEVDARSQITAKLDQPDSVAEKQQEHAGEQENLASLVENGRLDPGSGRKQHGRATGLNLGYRKDISGLSAILRTKKRPLAGPFSSDWC